MIRQAVCEDFVEVYPLFEQLWPGKTIDRGALYEAFARGASSGHDELLCAVLDGKIIGFPREKAHAFYEKLGFEKRAYLFSYILEQE